MEEKQDAILLDLLGKLELIINQKDVVKKGFNEDTVVYDLTSLKPNKLATIMSSSSVILSFDNSGRLKENGLVHAVSTFPMEKHALTFKGIVESLKIKYDISLEEQYLDFLKIIDSQYEKTVKKNNLDWKEKLTVLTLLLSMSSSSSSAINIMNNETNQEMLISALHDTLDFLEKYPLLKKSRRKRQLPKKAAIRGEAPAQFFMRMEGGKNLGRKTNQIFVRSNAGYYLDIEKNGELDEEKVLLLLTLIFESVNPDINYNALKNDLFNLSEKYLPAYLARDVNLNIKWSLTNRLESFFDVDIWRLPGKISGV